MIDSLFNTVFFCAHRRTTFPITPTRHDLPVSPMAARTGAYVVCLDCGKEFPYNWRELKIEPQDAKPVPEASSKKRKVSWLPQPLLRFLS